MSSFDCKVEYTVMRSYSDWFQQIYANASVHRSISHQSDVHCTKSSAGSVPITLNSADARILDILLCCLLLSFVRVNDFNILFRKQQNLLSFYNQRKMHKRNSKVNETLTKQK